jgi:transcriptional regulator with XRE-family HTH domain
MPKVNENRTVEWERHLARSIKQTRDRRGWTMESLAQKMTEAGCQMQKSAIAKIESPSPGESPRRITLDEAVTFANVFGLTLSEMLVPPVIAASREATSLWVRYERLRDTYLRTAEEMYDVEARLVELVETDPAVKEAVVAQHGEDADYSLDNITFMHRDPRMKDVYVRHMGRTDG